jgi:protein TonB
MLAGRGTIQNEDKGWEILEENEDFSYAQFSFENSWEAYKQRHPEKFTVYDTVEQMPSFPGGQSALFKYLSDEIIYPAVCINNKIQGRVIVSFIVERDGSITEAKIARSIDPALDKEALRVVRNMPNWIPGKRHGEKVRVKYTIPVTFRL